MPREQQETRRAYIERRALELAETGAFITPHAIEVALRAQGYTEAHEVLNRQDQRTRIHELCTQSRRMAGT